MTSRFVSRAVTLKILSREQEEGVGARVRRSIGGSKLRNFDPFLLLDEFSLAPPAGFPQHAHRGFETVTYMLQGEVQHEDFAGHAGKIGPGDLQWMTAGRGIVHSEMPVNTCTGMQLWVNLAKKDKMCEPQYQELLAKDVTKVEQNGIKASVVAGEALGVKSPVYTRTPVYYTHFQMKAGSRLEHPVPDGWNSFIYTLAGTARIAGQPIDAHYTVTFSQNGDGILVEAETDCSFLCIAGRPIGEPVVQYGPFVMNTQEEIAQTFEDYRFGKNGFENAHTWKGTIGEGQRH